MTSLELVQDRTQVAKLLEKIQNAETFGFDTESSGPSILEKGKPKGLNVYLSTMTGFSLAFNDQTAYYVPVRHHDANVAVQEAVKLLHAVIHTKGVAWAHNWKHDLYVLEREGWDIPDQFQYADSLVLMWLLNRPGAKGTYGLKALARQYLGMEMKTFEETVGKGGQFNAVAPADALKYACDDAVAALALGEKFLAEAAKKGLTSAFWDQEMPMVRVLMDMEKAGMRVDADVLSQLHDELQLRLVELKAEWDWLFPGISIQSPKQISESLFGSHWPTQGIPKTKLGYQVTAETMKVAQAGCKPGSIGWEAAEIRLEYQGLAKNISTYTTTLVERAQQYTDHRLHPSFLQHGTVTGRLSCMAPNLQNIPVRTELGRKVKAAFVPDPGNVFVSADYSQIELRMLAHLAQKGAFMEAYREGRDVHQETATLVGCSRDQGKTINFATVYGAGDKKMAGQLKTSVEQARHFLLKFRQVRPEIEGLKKQVLQRAYSRGFVRTYSGRIRELPELVAAAGRDPREETSEQRKDRWRGERLAFNTPIQGGSADVVKLGMIKFWRAIKGNSDVKLVCNVHDDVVSECKEKIAQEIAALQQECLEKAVDLRVPLVAQPKIGKNWAEAK